MRNPDLMQRLNNDAFFDADRGMSLVQRLEKEKDWTRNFAENAVNEYRRFLYLSFVNGQPLPVWTVIAQVWEMHMSFGADYWHGFCKDVLQFPLHRTPLPKSELKKKYLQTSPDIHALYIEEFGSKPPKNLWPTESSLRTSFLGLVLSIAAVAIGTFLNMNGMEIAPFFAIPAGFIGFAFFSTFSTSPHKND